MCPAARSPTLSPPDPARATPRWREPIALIDAQAKLLLEQDLSEPQRRSILTILRHAEELASDLARQDGGDALDLQDSGPTTERSGPAPSPTTSPFPAQHAVLPTGAAGRAGNARVLLADDDDEMLDLLCEILADRYELTLARDGAEAVAALAAHSFSLAIVDLNLPILDGFGVAEAMRVSERQHPPFMFLSAQASAQAKVRGLALGAADYVTKPFDPDELTARIARIIASVTREASLRADAMTDSLTGLCNYRSFTESLHREVERSRRYGQPLSLVTVDLDRLKAINDAHGHDAGNDAIVLLAQVLKGAVRSFDVVARNGGDEFALLLPNTGKSEALALAQRLRDELAQQPLRGAELTASIGVASRDKDLDLDAAALVKASDEALYRAKRAGRNRVELARP